ncbi:Methylcrotonoyl-CoA carboxylase beta chain, mitochondrial [Cyanidiococcus yangmingshanensis]|uniref:Methylcrotonoyl-CoA carboxylase beta chain, mitochondrial n=1 Tax=Cyanidiococcus yangmingshanensis TaxID=2690220 RepID=A0A7J7IG02_9RHOD|nr:Methylcrotonoyl-CoA carboxylase beta chain, mitochondrial [Cyanidiococcus yangmingshanensis]
MRTVVVPRAAWRLVARQLGALRRKLSSRVLGSQLDTTSERYRQGLVSYRALEEEYQRLIESAKDAGGPRARERHTSRGKLLARERIAALIDPGSPFLELSAFAGAGQYTYPSAQSDDS